MSRNDLPSSWYKNALHIQENELINCNIQTDRQREREREREKRERERERAFVCKTSVRSDLEVLSCLAHEWTTRAVVGVVLEPSA